MPENIATFLRDDVSLPVGIIPVIDTNGFASAGKLLFNTEGDTPIQVNYTSKTARSFLGATYSGSPADFARGTLVVQMATNDDLIKAKSRVFRGYRQPQFVHTDPATAASGGTGGVIQYEDAFGNPIDVSVANPLPVAGSLSLSTAIANNYYGTVSGLTVGASGTITHPATTLLVHGFTGYSLQDLNEADGEWVLTVGGTPVAFSYTGYMNRVANVYLPNPVNAVGQAIVLTVTNRGTATSNYRGIVLGE